MTNMLRDALVFVGRTEGWQTIDDMVDRLDRVDAWNDIEVEQVVREWKKTQVRRAVKQLKDDQGWPIFASVVTLDSGGNESRVYKQEVLFNHSDYIQVVTYHADRASYHWRMASGYRDRASRRGHQIPLPSPFTEPHAA